MIENERISGFGIYPLPEGKSFEEFKEAKQTHALALALLTGVSAAVYTGLIIGLSFISPFTLVALPFGFLPLAISFTYYAVKYMVIKNEFVPPADQMIRGAETGKLPSFNQTDTRDYSIITCPNAVFGNEWKKLLIEKAESNFILSGSYLGGEVFDELLDTIEVKMEKKSDFSGLVLTNLLQLTDSNKLKLKNLESRFPDRFAYTSFSEKAFLYSLERDRPLIASNHVKLLAIDGGRYVTIGGSGYTDRWRHGGHFNERLPTFAPATFRDTDFVLESPYENGLGQRVFYEGQKLFTMWHRRWGPSENIQLNCHKIDKAPASIEAFNSSPKKIDGCRIKFLASGVENDISNDCNEEYIRLVESEKSKITIAHMFVAPKGRLRKALIDAAKRGVEIEIITPKGYGGVPLFHYFYVQRSFLFLGELQEAASKNNVKVYLYDVDGVTYHKKMVLFGDATVLTGSSNMGARSLESHDNEINMVIQSKELCTELQDMLKLDKELSVLREDRLDKPLTTKLLGRLQQLRAFFYP